MLLQKLHDLPWPCMVCMQASQAPALLVLALNLLSNPLISKGFLNRQLIHQNTAGISEIDKDACEEKVML